jgi:hypothetical protein
MYAYTTVASGNTNKTLISRNFSRYFNQPMRLRAGLRTASNISGRLSCHQIVARIGPARGQARRASNVVFGRVR